MSRDLIARAQRGDREAFSSLVSASIGQLYATARLILRTDDRAEDAVQDALVRAWLDIRALRDPDRFEAWLRRLLIRACYRAAKRERVRQIAEIRALPSGASVVEDEQRLVAIRDQLDRAFRRLGPDQRAVLVLHFYVDLSDLETADALAVPIGTMKSRLNRATSALRAALEADEREPVFAEGSAR